MHEYFATTRRRDCEFVAENPAEVTTARAEEEQVPGTPAAAALVVTMRHHVVASVAVEIWRELDLHFRALSPKPEELLVVRAIGVVVADVGLRLGALARFVAVTRGQRETEKDDSAQD